MKPKILIIDIETSPAMGYFWSIFNTNIGINQISKVGQVICFAAKWLDEKKIYFYSDNKQTHKQVIKEAWKLLDEADAVVGYNSQSFDTKVLHKEFLLHGLPPPSPYKNIDLIKTIKGKFRFISNKLDHVSRELEIGRKTSHNGFDLWQACMNNDTKAWKIMERYNKQDVKLTEELYNKVKSWIVTPFNFNDHSIDAVCPNCNSKNLIRNGIYRSKTGVYQKFKCNNCFSHSRSSKSIKEMRKDESIVRQ